MYEYGMLGRCYVPFKQFYRMYEVGRYFLQHKFVIKRCKRRGKKNG